MKRYLPFIIIAAVLIIALASAAMLMRSSKQMEATTQSSPAPQATSKPAGPILPGADPPHVQGQMSAPVTLEEFGDFQCPPCGALHPEMKKIESEYGSRVRLIFRDFPLPRIHKHAVLAARAAEAADMQGRFWAMHDLLYENQPMWAPMPDARPVFISFARSLGLDMQRFTQDIDGPQASARIAFDQQRGDSLGVKGTPTLFINGRELPPQEMTPEGLRAAINAALGGKGK